MPSLSGAIVTHTLTSVRLRSPWQRCRGNKAHHELVPRECPRPFKCTRGAASLVQRRGASTHTGTFGQGQSGTLTPSQFLGNGKRYREVEATHTFVLYVLIAISHFFLAKAPESEFLFLLKK